MREKELSRGTSGCENSIHFAYNALRAEIDSHEEKPGLLGDISKNVGGISSYEAVVAKAKKESISEFRQFQAVERVPTSTITGNPLSTRWVATWYPRPTPGEEDKSSCSASRFPGSC